MEDGPRQKTLKATARGLGSPPPASHLPGPHSPKSSRAPSFLWSRDQHKGGVQSKQRISAQWLETQQKSMSIYKNFISILKIHHQIKNSLTTTFKIAINIFLIFLN